MNTYFLCQLGQYGVDSQPNLYWYLNTELGCLEGYEDMSMKKPAQKKFWIGNSPVGDDLPVFMALCAFAQAKGLLRSANHFYVNRG